MVLNCAFFTDRGKNIQPFLFPDHLLACKRGVSAASILCSDVSGEVIIRCLIVRRSSIQNTTQFLLELVDISAVLSARHLIPQGPVVTNVAGLALIHSLHS